MKMSLEMGAVSQTLYQKPFTKSFYVILLAEVYSTSKVGNLIFTGLLTISRYEGKENDNYFIFRERN